MAIYENQQIGNIKINGMHPTSKCHYDCECACGKKLALGTKDIRVKAKTFIEEGFAGCYQCWRQFKKSVRNNVELYRYVFNSYVKGARERNISFNLTREEFTEMIVAPCYYCGDINSNSRKDRVSEEILRYNGVDRIDSEQGYFSENCLPCCRMCNRMKNTLGYSEFINKCTAIAKLDAQRSFRREVGLSSPKRETSL